MINKEILDELARVTPEEQAILDGRTTVDESIYNDGDSTVISAKKLLSDGQQIRVRRHTRFIHFPEHTHDYVEAVYMCAGETTHIVNGKTLLLKEGDILFLGQNARQEILPAGAADLAINFIILPSFFDKTLEMLGAEETPIKNFLVSSLLDGQNKGYLHFEAAKILPVENLLENLIWTLMHNTPNRRNINQTTMGLLFMQLVNHTEALAHESREDAAVVRVLRYIEENYKSGSLGEAARLLHYDFFWLSREIKERTGRTYTEHLQEKRLSQAAYLLGNTGMSVEDVSIAVGYENKSYFHRIFSERFGKTPRKYRVEG